ncbi:MAG TPA: hypothetical protein VI029_10585, partial [Mycobacterium sp.]
MPQRTMKRLVTAIFAAGLIAGMALNSPSAWADPEVNPDPAAIDAPPVEQPLLPPPPPEEVPPPPAPFGFFPPPPPPVDPLAPPAPVDPFAPPPVDPLAANPVAPQPTVIPEGTPAGQDPTPYTGAPVFAPPTFNPLNGSMVGVAKPIYINFARP